MTPITVLTTGDREPAGGTALCPFPLTVAESKSSDFPWLPGARAKGDLEQASNGWKKPWIGGAGANRRRVWAFRRMGPWKKG